MALHAMHLTDGELAAVKAYRAANADTWAKFDKAHALMLRMEKARRAGIPVVKIARARRLAESTVRDLLKGVSEVLAAYRRRPLPSRPNIAVELLGDGE